MATVLDKELKRQVTVDGVDYTVAVDPDGFRLTGKGKRRPQVELRWRDLLSGEAALAVAPFERFSVEEAAGVRPSRRPNSQPIERASQRQRSGRGDRLTFSVAAMDQSIGGVVDVLDATVTIEIELPGVLGMIAGGLKGRLQKVGQLLLTRNPE